MYHIESMMADQSAFFYGKALKFQCPSLSMLKAFKNRNLSMPT